MFFSFKRIAHMEAILSILLNRRKSQTIVLLKTVLQILHMPALTAIKENDFKMYFLCFSIQVDSQIEIRDVCHVASYRSYSLFLWSDPYFWVFSSKSLPLGYYHPSCRYFSEILHNKVLKNNYINKIIGWILLFVLQRSVSIRSIGIVSVWIRVKSAESIRPVVAVVVSYYSVDRWSSAVHRISGRIYLIEWCV